MRTLLLLLLVGCGPQEPFPAPKGSHVDVKFVELLDDWAAHMRDADIDISRASLPHEILEVDTLALEYIGICVKYDDHWEIQIEKKLKGIVLQVVLWHELGHCVLDQKHWDNDSGDIMSEYILQNRKYWEELWDGAVARYLNKDLLKQHEGLE